MILDADSLDLATLRPYPSSLGSQVEARHSSGPQFSFYGPSGTHFGNRTCPPRTKEVVNISPGPARYSPGEKSPELLSSKSRLPSHTFSLRATWKETQIARLNRHRAAQMEWPSSTSASDNCLIP